MQCREFEDSLSGYFKEVESERIRDAHFVNDWSIIVPKDFYHQLLIQHVSSCDDCLTSLLWYLDIRNDIDYHEYPCLHLAYFCRSEQDRCIDLKHGLFSIIIDERYSIVIGNCPWCGIKLNTSGIV